MDVAVVAPAGLDADEEVHTRDGATIVHLGFRERFSLARSHRPWRRRATRAIASLDSDVVHGQGILTGGLPACDVETRPRIVTARGNVAQDTLAAYTGIGGKARAALRARLAGQVVRRADAMVGVHPDWRVNLPIEPARFTHIPNIVEECFFDAARRPVPGRVLYCGGPAPIKGFDVLLSAWPAIRKAVPTAQLNATGFDSASPVAGALADAITFLPALAPSQVAAEMATASALVIPSRFEVTPNVLSEAWAVGVPVVCTAAGGLVTLAAGAAVIVPPEEPAALGAAIVGVLEGDLEVAAGVAEGRRRAGLRTPAAIAAAHHALYRQIISADG